MKLLTKKIMAGMPSLEETAELDNFKSPVRLKLFNPCGSETWYIIAADVYLIGEEDKPYKLADIKNPDDESVVDVIFWCYVTGMGCDEWGTSSYKEMKALKLPFGLGIERDMYFDNKKLEEYVKIAA